MGTHTTHVEKKGEKIDKVLRIDENKRYVC